MTEINRRTVLYGTAAAAATATLAACSSSSSGKSAPSTGASASTADAIGEVAPSAVSTAGTPAVAGATNAAGALNTLGNASAVDVGGGVIFTAEKVVVTQPTKGVFKCFTAICTHQGCTVSSVANGKIVCPCHGSEYSIKDGSVITGPATTPLKAEKVTVTGGTLKLG